MPSRPRTGNSRRTPCLELRRVPTWSGFHDRQLDDPQMMLRTAGRLGGEAAEVGAGELPVSLVMDSALVSAREGHGPISDAIAG